jgi:hypothetical protein
VGKCFGAGKTAGLGNMRDAVARAGKESVGAFQAVFVYIV